MKLHFIQIIQLSLKISTFTTFISCTPVSLDSSLNSGKKQKTLEEAKKIQVELTPELELCLQEQKVKETDKFRLTQSGLKNCKEQAFQPNIPLHEKLCVLDLASVRPTQSALGILQVNDKKINHIQTRVSKGNIEDYLKQKPVPVVRGPANNLYLIDHHHLSRALLELNFQTTYGVVVSDLSSQSEDLFWQTMEKCAWVYPRLPNGQLADPSKGELPQSVLAMGDDPYRSLAGFVRRAKGYNKVNVPFVEFEWATFFRQELKDALALRKITDDLINENKEIVLDLAMTLARSSKASEVTGHFGLSVEEWNKKNETARSECPGGIVGIPQL